MYLGITLKAAEKKFGPALPGPATADTTLSAVRYAQGGAKKYAGIAGIHENAKFYIHFPTPIVWNLLTNKKGTPDFVNDLKESGPQGEQGREALVTAFLKQHETAQTKLREKREAVAKKAAASARKAEIARNAAARAGEYDAQLSIGGKLNTTLHVRVKVDAKGKVTLVVPKGKPLLLPPLS